MVLIYKSHLRANRSGHPNTASTPPVLGMLTILIAVVTPGPFCLPLNITRVTFFSNRLALNHSFPFRAGSDLRSYQINSLPQRTLPQKSSPIR